eukprot:8259875-Ditylum_brightwellii.AAC.1
MVDDVGFDDDLSSKNNNSEYDTNVEGGQDDDDDNIDQNGSDIEGDESACNKTKTNDLDDETTENILYLTCIDCKREQSEYLI